MDLSSVLSDFTTHLSGLYSNLRNTIHNNVSNALYDDLTTSKKAAGARDILNDLIKDLPTALNEYVTAKEGSVAGIVAEAAATAVEDSLGATTNDSVGIPTPNTGESTPAVTPTVSA